MGHTRFDGNGQHQATMMQSQLITFSLLVNIIISMGTQYGKLKPKASTSS